MAENAPHEVIPDSIGPDDLEPDDVLVLCWKTEAQIMPPVWLVVGIVRGGATLDEALEAGARRLGEGEHELFATKMGGNSVKRREVRAKVPAADLEVEIAPPEGFPKPEEDEAEEQPAEEPGQGG